MIPQSVKKSLLLAVLAVGIVHPIETSAEAIYFPKWTEGDITEACLFRAGTIIGWRFIECRDDERSAGIFLRDNWPKIKHDLLSDCLGQLQSKKLRSFYYLRECLVSIQEQDSIMEK